MYQLSVAGLIIVCLGFGWYQSNLKEDIAVKAKDAAELRFDSINAELMKIGEDLDRVEKLMTDYQQTKQEVQYVTKETTKQVIEYRDRVVNRCQLSSVWVSTYNTSTLLPHQSAARTDDSSRGNGTTVDDAVALGVTTRNNRQCVTEKERLRALQEWVRGLTGGNIPPSS